MTRQRLYLETLENIFANTNKVMIDVDKSNNLLYLPLDKMVGKGMLPPELLRSREFDSQSSGSGSSSSNGQRYRDLSRSREARQ